MSMQVFSKEQADTYAAWCDILVAGAARAGVAHFVDQNIAGPYDRALLFLRFSEAGPLADYYLGGLSGIDTESNHRFGVPFLQLSQAERQVIVEAAIASKSQAWKRPDPSFFYLVSRNDAVDVVYGTEAGFKALDTPYMAHILPEKPW
ncbi:gluconate 2-dehydrogenase subunit 3 family protein [Hoeflea sp. TYP-13]|uniref:gluconate 2-dehydrogenase subunit 3 family protein n=1 Tax=Hoeflea sp. TYP-13 TaxID=3230023 RepID=UPI0034C61FC0